MSEKIRSDGGRLALENKGSVTSTFYEEERMWKASYTSGRSSHKDTISFKSSLCHSLTMMHQSR